MPIERGPSPEEMGIKKVEAKPEVRNESEIKAQLQRMQLGLRHLKGRQMREVLDREYELNSALSPMDSTDPNKRAEYEDWKRALETSRRATQELKQDLERKIEEGETEINRLLLELRKTEK